jgi:hypothetical protein
MDLGDNESDDDDISMLDSSEKAEELSSAGLDSEPESFLSLDDSSSNSSSSDTDMHLPQEDDSVADSSDGRPGESMRLPADDFDDRPSRDTGNWIPGQNCGKWLVGRLGIGVEAQVLLTNMYLTLRQMPTGLLKTVLSHLMPPGQAAVERNFADRLVARLCGVSHSMARWVCNGVRTNGWVPISSSPLEDSDAGATTVTDELSPITALMVRIRECLHVSHWGRPDTDYTRAMSRLESHGLQLGSKYLGHQFVELVEILAVVAVRSKTADVLARNSPSLGVPSDIAIIWDGVSIGARSFSRHETLYLCGLTYMAWPETKREQCSTKALFMAGPSAGQSHTGPEQVKLLLRAFENHPAQLDKHKLASRLAAVGADGAATKGGENAQHSGSGASEMLWSAVHPNAKAGSCPAVEWDLFHRVDLAASKAIEACPAAVEIFDIARVMGALFGTGDGRVMLRATQDLIGQKRLRVPDQGGTRKVVALAHTVDHLLRNMQAFHAALHARRGQGEGAKGRGAQTKQHLIQIGRRISNLNFVVFVIFVRDTFQRRVAPIALKAQAVNIASWEMDRLCHEAGADIVRDKAKLFRLQTWCIVSSLLHSYVQKQDLRHLWLILSISDLGNSFPKLVQNMYGLLHAQQFSLCALNMEHHLDSKDHNMLSPRCQCATMRSRPGPAPRRAVIELPRGRRLPNSVQGDRGILRVSVPEWVAFSVYSPNEWKPSGLLLPRYIRVCRETAPPIRLQGVSRFSQAQGSNLCVVPSILPAALKAVVEALAEAALFIDRLAYHWAGYVTGSVGINKTMRETMSNAKLCWDWQALTKIAPTKQQHMAFFELYLSLRPALLTAEWPTSIDFAWLTKTWPEIKGTGNTMWNQYQTMMRRVRLAAGHKSEDTRHWWDNQIFLVQSVLHSPCLSCSLGRCAPFRSARHNDIRCILGLILRFASASVSDNSPPFRVSQADVAAPGCGRTLKAARKLRHQHLFRGSEGSFASLASSCLKGHLVRVVHIGEGTANEVGIASTMMTDRRMVFPDKHGRHCWHAVRVYLRTRMQRAPESGVERWGSLLHDLWDVKAGWHPARMVSRLHIREAGVQGSATDENLVHEIALFLHMSRNMNPFVQRPSLAVPRAQMLPDFVVRHGLQVGGIDPTAWRAAACPSTLLPPAAHAVLEAQRLGKRDVLAPLPWFVQDVRTSRKGKADSTVTQALNRWLRTKEAEEWRDQRRMLFPNLSDLAEDQHKDEEDGTDDV